MLPTFPQFEGDVEIVAPLTVSWRVNIPVPPVSSIVTVTELPETVLVAPQANTFTANKIISKIGINIFFIFPPQLEQAMLFKLFLNSYFKLL